MIGTARRRPAALLVALVTAALAVAGCAGSSSGAGSDPASVVPASAPLYAEAVLAGNGQEQADAQAALGKILGTSDPQGQVLKLFDRGNVRFARDVEPWLGEKVAAAALTLGRGGDKVVVASSRDDTEAQAALGRIAPGATRHTYRGVSYRVDTGHRGFAAGVVGDTVVLGSENGLKAAIDASKGNSLAEADALKQARSTVRQERSAFLYVDVAGLLRQTLANAGGGAQQLAPFVDPIAQALPKTFAAALDAQPDLVRLDSAAFGNGGAQTAASGADALAALPGDAWLGLGVGELGQTVNGFLDRVTKSSPLAGVGVQALLGQAQQNLGIDIRQDLLPWMGDAGVYLAGASADDARVALVVASKDPAASQRTVDALQRLAARDGHVTALNAAGVDRGFAVRRSGGHAGLYVAAGGNRFVVANSRAAVAEALASGGARLGDAPAFRDAAAKLGSGVRPSFFVDVQKLSGVAAAKRGHGGDHARELREYLGAFGAVVGGAKRDGDVTRGETIATLR